MALEQPSWVKDIILSQNGDQEARARVVNDNIPLVWSLVHRFKNGHYDKEDLFQIGCLGLLKAIDRFDVSLELRLSTYAVPIILGEIKKHFRDDGAIKVSRSLKEANIKINYAKNKLTNLLNRDPQIEEIAKEVCMDVGDVVMAMESNYYPTSLNEPIFEKDGSSLFVEDRICIDESEKLLNEFALKEELKKLDEEERMLIYYRYYLELNQEEIAKKFNVSQVQISRLEKKIVEKLRKQLV